jgi:hypothetical protein
MGPGTYHFGGVFLSETELEFESRHLSTGMKQKAFHTQNDGVSFTLTAEAVEIADESMRTGMSDSANIFPDRTHHPNEPITKTINVKLFLPLKRLTKAKFNSCTSTPG